RWRAREQLPVGPHFVSLCVDLDMRRRGVMHHAVLTDSTSGVLNGDRLSLEVGSRSIAARAFEEGPADEQQGRPRGGRTQSCEHGAVVDRLWCWDARVRVPHRRRRNATALEYQIRLYREEGRRPD